MFATGIFTLFLFSLQLIPSHQEEMPVRDKKFKLLSGDLMPMIGLGTFRIGNSEIKEILDLSLAAGYRHIDTASAYHNEEGIGSALKELLPKYNLTREDIFITTKLQPNDLGDGAYGALEDSLKRLQTDYVDLYLIHWPGPFRGNLTQDYSVKRDQSWQHLVNATKNRLARNIGVSNYHIRHLKELLQNDHGVKPAVNQFEWHPLYHPEELKQLCNKEGILLEAYSPLGSGNNELLKNPKVLEIAKKLGKSPAQVLLRWGLQQDIAIIPKARSKDHLEENLQLDFVIPEEDMQVLSGFQQHKFAPDPSNII